MDQKIAYILVQKDERPLTHLVRPEHVTVVYNPDPVCFEQERPPNVSDRWYNVSIDTWDHIVLDAEGR